MNELLVVIPCSVTPDHPDSGTMKLYLSQLEAAGIEYIVFPLSPNRPNANGGGTLGYKVELFRTIAQQYSYYKRLIISDAFDVTFWGTKDEVIAKIYDNMVLCAAERNCYPEQHLAVLINGGTPWRFFNGGLTAGTPTELLKWMDKIEQHDNYTPHSLDQTFFNRRLAEGSSLAEIDYETELFYCTFGEEGDIADLQFTADGHPHNTRCDTFPCFIHCNGKWPSDHIFARRKK